MYFVWWRAKAEFCRMSNDQVLNFAQTTDMSVFSSYSKATVLPLPDLWMMHSISIYVTYIKSRKI
jgi:hypothetical protein